MNKNELLRNEVKSIEHCIEVLKDCDKHCSTANMMVISIKNSCNVIRAVADDTIIDASNINKKVKSIITLKREYDGLNALRLSMKRHGDINEDYYRNIEKRIAAIIDQLNSLIK